MGLGEGRSARAGARRAGDSRRLRRRIARLAAGGLLVIGILCISPAVAAAGTTTPPATPPADPTTPPPAPPASGTNGLLAPGTSSSTPSAAPTASPAPSATPSGTAVVMPLQPPTADVPVATVSPTGTRSAPSPTAPQPTATTARPTNTPTIAPTPTGTPTGIPTGNPTGTPGADPASAELAKFVLLEDPGTGGNATIARTAVRHFGEFTRPDGIPWTGWCEMFVGDVLYEAGIPHPRYEAAIVDAVSGPLYRGRAPAGSLVFFDQRSDPNGHVGIALGDGTMLSALGNGIVRSAYEAWPSYVGWRPYGTTAPQDQPFMLAPLLQSAAQDAPLQMPPWPEQSRWYTPPPYIAPQTATK